MVMIALCSSLIGAVLGTHYKVHVLFPAAVAGMALIAAVALLRGSTPSTTLFALGSWTVCLQLGYLGGLFTRYCLEAAGLAPQRSLHSTIARN
jgi:hypothetical protein